MCVSVVEDRYKSFINDLPNNVDVCGENGEFHSYVFDGPMFKQPINFIKVDIVQKFYEVPQHNNNLQDKYSFRFCDLLAV